MHRIIEAYRIGSTENKNNLPVPVLFDDVSSFSNLLAPNGVGVLTSVGNQPPNLKTTFR